jgi:hypothetical protein
LRLESNALALCLEEWLAVFETQGGRELRVVSQDGMDIEREMSAVEGEIVVENLVEHSPAAACDRLQARPEQAVVDDEKVDAAGDCKIDRPSGGIHSRANLRDCAGVLDLEAIERIGPIVDLADPQMLVGIGDDLG